MDRRMRSLRELDSGLRIAGMTSVFRRFLNYSSIVLKHCSFVVLLLCGTVALSYAAPFVDNHNGTVTDNKTGLIWQQSEPGYMTWDSALSYCENLELPSGSGQRYWRLPNIKELESITDDTRPNPSEPNSPSIDPIFFPNAYAYGYWSSTTYAYYPYSAWLVGFGGSGVGYSYDKYDFYYVRCVRAGQSGSFGTLGYFDFSSITSSQSVGTPFSVTITARDVYGNAENYNGYVSLYSNAGSVNPITVWLANGTWTGNVTLYEGGAGIYLGATAGGKYGTSNAFDVTGGVSSTGSLHVKVYDNRHNHLAGATVYLDLNNDGTEEYSHVTDSNGKYQFTGLPTGVYRVRAEFDSKSESDTTYVASSGLPATVYLTLPVFPSCKTPVILLPGIMGSNKRGTNIVYPQLPGPERAKASDLILHDPDKKVGWRNLIEDQLQPNGYEKNVSIIECPYDWRMPVEQVVDAYLKPCIKRAKDATGSLKVNIIAHSTGGLVTRAYIQSDDYAGRNDIYRFAMVGTPNLGSVNAYYTWEGGDPLWADNLNEDGLLSKVIFPNFYWNTVERMWERTYKKGNLRPNEHIEILNFVTSEAKELRDLLPTFDFLEYGSRRYITSSDNKNQTLIDLNSGQNGFVSPSNRMGASSSGGKVETRVFYSSSENTTRSHDILNPAIDRCPVLWTDGQPSDSSDPVYLSGDGTVWTDSAKLPYDEGWAGRVGSIKSSEHKSLIKNYAQELYGFVDAGEPVCQFAAQMKATATATATVVNTISVLVDGRAQPYLLDPNGLGAGANTSTGNVENNITSSEVNLQTESANISVENPSNGTYTLYIKGVYNEDYNLTIDYADSSGVKSLTFHGFNHSNTTSFTITVNSASEDKVTVNHTPLPPTGLLADAVDDGGLKTALSWTASSDPAVTGYNIYARYDDEPYLAQIGTSAVNSFDTGDAWAENDTIVPSLYAVSALKADGTESFLSDMAKNDDRDHDGLTDGQETGLGTNISNPDSDGDGLKDGEEYTRGTDPLLTDTDGDGYSDYDEVQAGTDPLDPDPNTVTITANDPTATEAGLTTGQFTVTRTGATTSALTVNYAASGTAVSDSDYSSIGTSVIIPASLTSATITITPINDTEVEIDETVVVTLSSNAAYVVDSPSNTTFRIMSCSIVPM